MKQVDVAVVGAGPAGIAAALAAAESGANTVLIDENPDVGGQLRWRLSPTMSDDIGLGVEAAPGPTVARQLSERLQAASNLTIATGTVAWGLFENNVLGISTDGGADEVRAESIVLATGSTDITHPFPGWTLPGVLTVRAVQIFMHVHRVLPGRNWAILGDTPEADEIAEDLERAGTQVLLRVTDVEQVRASGTNRLAHVEQGDEVVEVDGLAIALGRQPDPELAIQAKAEAAFSWQLGGYTARRTATGETSVPGVYVAGDAAGIGSLPEIVAEGRLAGLAAAGAGDAEISKARNPLDQIATESRQTAIKQLHLDTASA